MNHLMRTTLVAATVLLTGTVAFAVTVYTAPPSVDRISVVVTDRPVGQSTQPPASASATAPAPVAAAITIVPVEPITAGASAPRYSLRSAVKRVVAPVSAPKVIKVPSVVSEPEDDDDDDDREVVTPSVRDDEHDDDAEHSSSEWLLKSNADDSTAEED